MIDIRTLTAEAFAPFGVALGVTGPFHGPDAYLSADSDFWHEHLFDAGGGQPEVLWVRYRSREPHIRRLEAHRLTEQAVIPLTAPIIQIVAPCDQNGAPDAAGALAFRVAPGQGLLMRAGCWHATRVEDRPATCAMLTRRSTTLDLAGHLNKGETLSESVLRDVDLVLRF
ncbi:MAG TPA: ureidoglycolate lyase [Aquamicrobium sp.]|nr:ureidoglycolate lyase [Aquamicrobium sp.]